MSDDFNARCDAILRFPGLPLEYQRWLSQTGDEQQIADGYLFSKAASRFEARPSDVLVALADLRVTTSDGRVSVSSVSNGATVEVSQVAVHDCERLIALIDGQRTAHEISELAEVAHGVIQALLKQCLGVVIFAPRAVAQLEQRVSGLEIVRFTGSPYEVVRPYWENCADVVQALEGQHPALTDSQRLPQALRELHVRLLLGSNLDSFYRPASPIAKHAIYPGQWLDSPAHWIEAEGEKVITAGARVNAALLGGDLYPRLLCKTLSDDEALNSERTLSDAQGLDWGRLMLARTAEEAAVSPAFIPPRPIQDAHWQRIASHFATALAHSDILQRSEQPDPTARSLVVEQLAHFHQCFIRLHPFQCGNQSLAMLLCNHVLRRSHGAGMPHGVLDHFALRLNERSYAELFARAVQTYLVTGTPIQRYQTLVAHKMRSYALIARIAQAPSTEAAQELIAQDAVAARAALLI
ncbi:MAG TPA: Fic family protein [Polyangiaceae bacterium]|nr:Fic family protein [Polyangiaceae bacterium]